MFMKKLFAILCTATACLVAASAAAAEEKKIDENYHRSSMSIVTVIHPADSFSTEIQQAVLGMPFPEKYDNLDLGLTFLNGTPHADRKADLSPNLNLYMKQAKIANFVVAKWFNFNGNGFNMDLIRERGQYDASVLDVQKALQTVRGKAMLDDVGEELLTKTFFLVNDISYVDHEERARIAAEGSRAVGAAAEEVGKAAGEVLSLFGGIGSAIGGLVSSAGSMVNATAGLVGDITDMLNISGFVVRINTYLYQLEWNDSIANEFYTKYYTEGDSAKVAAFWADSTTFRMKYVGSHEQFTDKGTMYSQKSQSEQMLVTCTRTLDKNIINLQKKYPDFQVKTPISEVVYNDKGKEIGYKAYIGLKEGITPKSKFIVLEKVEKDGRTEYRQVGQLSPVKGQICDNRYMAAEEMEQSGDGKAEKTLDGTILKGTKKLMPGMLIIEGKLKK